MKLHFHRLFIVLLGLTIVSSLSVQRLSMAGTPSAATRPAIPIVEFSGDPARIGAAHGQRFGDDIRLLHDQYLLKFLGGSQGLKARLAAGAFELHMLPEHRAELAALQQSVGVNHLDMVLAQCFLDLMPVTACSTITLPASASPDGVARFGRNLDFPSLNLADKYSVLIIYHPKGRYQFAAIGWPGMIGVLSGMNEHGLSLANMEVPRQPRLPTAMPYTLLYRTILEQCKTVDEAIDLLRKTPRQTANNLMLMDATGDRAVAEIRPEGVNVRQGGDNTALISTNHQRDQDQATAGMCWRYDLLHETAGRQFGRIDVLGLEKMLGNVVQGDHGDMTLQSMIFEPANRVVYIAVGSDAPVHPYDRIDLKTYFISQAATRP